MLQVARLAALIVFAAASAEAQQLAGTFDQLRVLAKAGDTLTVTDGSGQRVRGKLTTLSTDSLVLSVAGTPRAFQTIDVDTIEKRGSDSLKNGGGRPSRHLCEIWFSSDHADDCPGTHRSE